VTLVLDAGALIALERNERPMWTRLKALQAAGDVPVTHGGVLGQAWLGGARQARLATAVEGITVESIDRALGRAASKLLGAARRSDVLDACLVLLAGDGDEIVTADRHDIEVLAAATGRHVELIRP
jgi:hypothetical protein